jgi:hypothetical protein
MEILAGLIISIAGQGGGQYFFHSGTGSGTGTQTLSRDLMKEV